MSALSWKLRLRETWKNLQAESHKKKRRNYAKADHTAIKKFFYETEWMKIKKLKNK